MGTIINPRVEFYHHNMNCFYGDIISVGDISTKPQPKFTFRNAAKFQKLGLYDSIATVGEIRVYWRADFHSGSRVLKKVF